MNRNNNLWRTRNSFCSMYDRCYRPNNPSYQRYGMRGLTVCDRWNRDKQRTPGQAFSHFLEDMGKRPENTTLDRIDNNKGYSPDNCQWSDRKAQANNRRNTVRVTAFGETKTVSQWTRDSRCVVNRNILDGRIKNGVVPEVAITVKKLPQRKKKRKTYRRTFIVFDRPLIGKRYLAFGQSKTIKEWSQDSRCAVTYEQLRKRFERDKKHTYEELIATPCRKRSDSLPISQLSQDSQCVVSYDCLLTRLRKGMPLEKALATPSKVNPPTLVYTWKGKTKTIREWSKDKRCVVCYETLNDRLRKRGWEIGKALTTPARGT